MALDPAGTFDHLKVAVHVYQRSVVWSTPSGPTQLIGSV
jgi:hypothetical protein